MYSIGHPFDVVNPLQLECDVLEHLELSPLTITLPQVEEGVFQKLQSLTLSLRCCVYPRIHPEYRHYFVEEHLELTDVFMTYFESTKYLQKKAIGGGPPPPPALRRAFPIYYTRATISFIIFRNLAFLLLNSHTCNGQA